MTIIDHRSGCGLGSVTDHTERRDSSDDGVPPGFTTAIAMAEAAASHNPTWWNEIRTHTDDSSAGEYCSSLLLGTLLEASAHRLGVPAADVWAHIWRTGELPL